MKIVVTNDDGYDAAGLAALAAVARQFGEVFMVAPATPQSYMGHRVTTVDPIDVIRISDHEYRVTGTPADCARIALRCVVPDAAWLFSGINHGGNLGVDVYISGTVAAAREAVLLGYQGLAISQYKSRGREIDWDLSQQRAMPVLADILSRPVREGRYWNINLPHPPDGAPPPGVCETPLDRQPLDVSFRHEGDRYIYAGLYQRRPFRPDTDVAHCFAGQITVTPLDL